MVIALLIASHPSYDRHSGAVNIIVPMTWIAAILTFAWPYAQSQSSLIAIAVLYGLSNAAFVSSFNVPLYEMGEMGDVGRRIGTVMMFNAAGGLLGPPISGAIFNKTGGLEAVSYYAGKRMDRCSYIFFSVLTHPSYRQCNHCFHLPHALYEVARPAEAEGEVLIFHWSILGSTSTHTSTTG